MQAVLAQHWYRIRDTRLRSSAILNACFDIHFLLFPDAANALPPVTLRPPPGIFQHGLDTSRPGSIHLRVIDILCASLQALLALGSRRRDYTQSVSLPRAMSLMAYCSRTHCVRAGPKRHHGAPLCAPIAQSRASRYATSHHPRKGRNTLSRPPPSLSVTRVKSGAADQYVWCSAGTRFG